MFVITSTKISFLSEMKYSKTKKRQAFTAWRFWFILFCHANLKKWQKNVPLCFIGKIVVH
jgi:hypothetical protein